MSFPEADPSAENWEVLPTLSLVNTVCFPGRHGRVRLDSLRAFGAVREAMRSAGDKTVAVFAMREHAEPSPATPAKLFEVGTLAHVRDLCRRPCCGRWVALIEATRRVRLIEGLRDEPFRIARVAPLDEPQEDAALLGALVAEIRRSAVRFSGHARCPRLRNAIGRLRDSKSALDVPGIAMELLSSLTVPEQQRALELPLLSARLAFVLQRLNDRRDGRDGRRDGRQWS